MQEMPSLIMSLSAKQEISQLLGENAAFECFALMPFYDIVSFTAAAAIIGIPSSLFAALHSF